MPDINKLFKTEMIEIIDFYNFIEEYGHIYHEKRDEQLKKEFSAILKSIKKIRKVVDDSYSI